MGDTDRFNTAGAEVGTEELEETYSNSSSKVAAAELLEREQREE